MVFVPDDQGLAEVAAMTLRHMADHYQPVLDDVADDSAGESVGRVRRVLQHRWDEVDAGVPLPPGLAHRIAAQVAQGRRVRLIDELAGPADTSSPGGS